MSPWASKEKGEDRERGEWVWGRGHGRRGVMVLLREGIAPGSWAKPGWESPTGHGIPCGPSGRGVL